MFRIARHAGAVPPHLNMENNLIQNALGEAPQQRQEPLVGRIGGIQHPRLPHLMPFDGEPKRNIFLFDSKANQYFGIRDTPVQMPVLNHY